MFSTEFYCGAEKCYCHTKRIYAIKAHTIAMSCIKLPEYRNNFHLGRKVKQVLFFFHNILNYLTQSTVFCSVICSGNKVKETLLLNLHFLFRTTSRLRK